MTFAHRRRRQPGREWSRARSSESGMSLLEVLLVVILLGTSIVAITAGVFTATKASIRAQSRTQVSVFLQSWSERTLSPTYNGAWNYEACGAPPSGIPSSSEYPNGWDVSWQVEFLDTATPVAWTDPTFKIKSSSFVCTTTMEKDPVSGAEVPRDGGLQRIKLRVKTNASNTAPEYVADTVTIYKRDPRCSPQYDNADLGPC